MLIVDDSKPIREIVKRLFKHKASYIYECEDGAEAFASYEQHHPDWVLMDIAMKQVDGITATKNIIAVYPHARIIILTQYDDPFFREEAKIAGACGYVVKENLMELNLMLEQIKK